MERLEAKKIHGRTYYYYSKWAWVNGKCRRVWQKYLGKLEDIVKAVDGGGPPPEYAEVFEWGLPSALWKECRRAQIVDFTDALCPKRQQGLSTGEYLAVAAVNRAVSPRSKRSMWPWFSQTVLLRHLPHSSKAALSSQRFWDHMDRIDSETARNIWKNLLQATLRREPIDLSSVSYDGTNFYTFIDTFNSRCKVAQRGKNKQGRNSLRQISYALFCGAEGSLPLYYDVYEGNRNDARQFPVMLKRFNKFLQELYPEEGSDPEITLIFDKGNNSEKNFQLLDSLPLKFVGSVKLDQHKDLLEVSNQDERFESCRTPELKGTKAFRVLKPVYGQERVLVVTYHQNLFDAQWLTLHNDLSKAVRKLSALREKLDDRIHGTLKGGSPPALESIHRQCQRILSRRFLERVVRVTVSEGPDEIPRLEYEIDAQALAQVADTYLGKNLLISDRTDWDDDRIIKAYRSQFIIEDVFKQMKDRCRGNWWPLNHWTDSKIQVHGLYCTIALLLRALLMRRVRQAGLKLPITRVFSELDAIREVVNVFPRKRNQKTQRKQTVLTRTSEVQRKLISILGLEPYKPNSLG
jgi:transposase